MVKWWKWTVGDGGGQKKEPRATKRERADTWVKLRLLVSEFQGPWAQGRPRLRNSRMERLGIPGAQLDRTGQERTGQWTVETDYPLIVLSLRKQVKRFYCPLHILAGKWCVLNQDAAKGSARAGKRIR